MNEKRITVAGSRLAAVIGVWLLKLPDWVWGTDPAYERARAAKRHDSNNPPNPRGMIAAHIADQMARHGWEASYREQANLFADEVPGGRKAGHPPAARQDAGHSEAQGEEDRMADAETERESGGEGAWEIVGPDADGAMWFEWTGAGAAQRFHLGAAEPVAEKLADTLGRMDYGA